jgi:membrane-associated phospholipid phosphatase
MAELDANGGNAAPSLHVSLTCLLACALVRDFPRWWPVIVGGVGLVWLATLFTWQHHLLDVMTGAGLALIFALLPGVRRTRSHLPSQGSSEGCG